MPNVISILCVFLPLAAGVSVALAQQAPSIGVQPADRSVSLGATIALRVTAGGSSPLVFEWRHDDLPIPGAAGPSLNLSNAVASMAGAYHAIVRNDFGAVTSKVARVDVDPTFTKITAGVVATEGGDSSGSAWGDFDNDGWPDLFVGNGTSKNFLYRNNRDGTFAKLTNSVPATEARYGGSWADYDNDGWLDLFAAGSAGNSLYRNNGDGTFTKVVKFAGSASSTSWSGSWGDYDRDGWLDLFISNGAGNSNFLLHNNGDGSFTSIKEGRIVRDGGATIGATWQDYDHDGWPDLYAANNGGVSFLYHNLRNGAFERVLTGAIATDSQSAIVPDWGDYDNDGFPDLAVGGLGRNLLYRNLGDATFARIRTGPFVTDSQTSEIALWVDYDNDGFLDLFSANAGGQNETLYHNNGDGAFTRVLTGSIVNDGGNSAGAAWADYDNDGFPDLFVANWQGSRPNFLYRNNGNANHWLKVRCVGGVSNRDGIGARVSIQSRLRGADAWQMREISGGTGFGQTSLLAHFGLGEGALVSRLRIEWPSGLVQELKDVRVDQTLTVVEPPRLRGAKVSGGNLEWELQGLVGAAYLIESSADLSLWSSAATLVSTSRVQRVSEILPAATPRRFYRARGQ